MVRCDGSGATNDEHLDQLLITGINSLHRLLEKPLARQRRGAEVYPHPLPLTGAAARAPCRSLIDLTFRSQLHTSHLQISSTTCDEALLNIEEVYVPAIGNPSAYKVDMKGLIMDQQASLVMVGQDVLISGEMSSACTLLAYIPIQSQGIKKLLVLLLTSSF
ncbi:uncharacterized protein LOC124691079 [Lolium rigidum]|uniref:uncharacterized protein LOC124691079 n=1 Tax=Lolium rigidum TaxID=89674 RepID=UPI001F5D734F|nr:uncharacterized protein LOC124691079 [Lolium rigidum]